MRAYGSGQHDGSRICEDRQQRLHQEVRPFDVDVERAVEHVFGPFLNGHPDGYAGIEEGNVELAVVLLDDLCQLPLCFNAG
ncbi:hypothetical protein D3C79_809040 [compost metagenome]